jgi:threonine-phosphate decarboxylase
VVLNDSAYQKTWEWLNRERPRLRQALENLPGLSVWPGVANYLFLRCDTGIDLQQALLHSTF